MLEPLPDTPFISVFGLTYNHEQFVARAIESVLAEGWPADRFEYVLLDDGSSDGTPEQVAPYADRITYLRQENQGIHAAVSRVISLLRGDLIMSCGGDDEWPKGKLERTVEYFRAHPDVGLAYSDVETIDAQGRLLARSFLESAGYTERPTGQIAGALIGGNFINGGSMAFRGVFKDDLVPLPPDAAWEDWWFAWQMTNLAPVGYLDAVTYRYRFHGSNLVFGSNSDQRAIDNTAHEVPFTRYLLGNARPGTCKPGELLFCAEALRFRFRRLAAAGRDVQDLVAVGDQERAAGVRLTEQARAVRRAAPALAAFAAARALAADPFNPDAFQLLHDAAGAPNVLPPPIDGAHAVTVFADLEELVAKPKLLADYVAAFSGLSGVTLVAVARSWDAARLGQEVGPLEQLLSGDDAPDVIASPADDGMYLNALTRADAALGLRDLPVPGIRRFTDATALRAYAERRLRLPFVR